MGGFVKTITAITLVSTLSINRPTIALKGNKMLVKEYFELEIANRPYKYQTRLNMVRCLKKLELWEMEYETLTPAICWERIEGIINQNVKRTYAGYVRNVFNYGRNQIPVVMSESKIYDLPTQEDLHKVIESSKYRFYLLLCMYAGLRIGEACAVVPQQVKKEGLNYFLHVDRAFSQDGKSFGSPKTIGKVMIPKSEICQKKTPYLQQFQWEADELGVMDPDQVSGKLRMRNSAVKPTIYSKVIVFESEESYQTKLKKDEEEAEKATVERIGGYMAAFNCVVQGGEWNSQGNYCVYPKG
jgi:hypothetical protein